MRRRRFPFDDFDEFFESYWREFEKEIEELFRRLSRFTEEEVKGPFIYGFRVTIGPDGIPHVEKFGNIKRVGPRPRITEEREPLYDVYEEADKVIIYVELPGVEKEKIDLNVSEKMIIVKASDDNRRYYREITLPTEVEPSTAKAQYKNGVLEVKIDKKVKEEKKEGIKVKIE